MNKTRIAIFILGPSALDLALQIKASLGGEIHGPQGIADCDQHYMKATQAIAHAFSLGQPIIGICASGILIRAVASLITNKHEEPPLVAVAENGSTVVPLLGGHHGANELARKIAALTRGQAAITTASGLRTFNRRTVVKDWAITRFRSLLRSSA